MLVRNWTMENHPMKTKDATFEIACRQQSDEFFASYRDMPLRNRAAKMLQFLAANEKAFSGRLSPRLSIRRSAILLRSTRGGGEQWPYWR
jgi:hypothetical protein